MEIHKLSNGIRVTTEQLPYLRSVSVGIWVGAGCFAEVKKNNGISHFIEHMVFKGTENRTAKEIAGCIDALGGQLNAFTAKECTCFYVNILNEHYGLAIDVLCDLVMNARLDDKDITMEKGVVCEEIAMVEDTPDEVAADKLAEAYYGAHPLGQTILGPAETVKSITRSDITDYMASTYTCENIVVSVAGCFDEKAVLDMLEEKLTLAQHGVPERQGNISKYTHKSIIVEKDIEQVNLCLGLPGVSQTSDDYFAQSMIANIFGGGMSSRLFQRVREQNGMTYSIYSYLDATVNTGMVAVYAGMNPEQAPKVFELIMDEAEKMKKDGITEKEFCEAREQLKGSFVLGLESARTRMTRNGRVLLLNGKVLTVDEVIAGINSVTNDDIIRNIQAIFDFSKMSSAAVGKCSKAQSLAEMLKM